MDAAEVLRQARLETGLTQAGLAERLGTSQAAIARLERAGANPTVQTLDRVMHGLGRRLELSAPEANPSIDETLVAANLARTPAERLAAFSSWYGSVKRMAENARRAGGQLA